ncbi:MAG: WD40 repeat domain-containing protein [Caulobacterales bacterium]
MTVRVYTDGRRLALKEGATAAAWIGGDCLFALGDGSVLIQGAESAQRIEAHQGAILCAALHPDGKSLLTGGDDGRIARTTANGETEIFSALGRKWVDHIAASSVTGVVVAAQGKEAAVFPAKAREPAHRFVYPSSIGGFALDAKGRRLAASHYGGATIRYVLAAEDSGVKFNWAGSHLAIALSPDAEFVVTGMQETGLHGWRIADKLDLRMEGYPSKTRSFSWDRRGKWLATSGAHCAVVWPFSGKVGPQGKSPALLGERQALVTCVAFHPREEWLAMGYADGAVRLERMADNFISEIDEPGEGPVTALAWNADGSKLAIGDAAGRGGIVSIS